MDHLQSSSSKYESGNQGLKRSIFGPLHKRSFVEIFPVLDRDVFEGLDHKRIKLSSAKSFEFAQGFLITPSFSIDSITDHCVKSIDDGEDPSPDGDTCIMSWLPFRFFRLKSDASNLPKRHAKFSRTNCGSRMREEV